MTQKLAVLVEQAKHLTFSQLESPKGCGIKVNMPEASEMAPLRRPLTLSH